MSQKIELTEKEKVMECIKALSKIEGYTMSYEGMKRTNVLYDNIDLLMKYFEDKNKELINIENTNLYNPIDKLIWTISK